MGWCVCQCIDLHAAAFEFHLVLVSTFIANDA